MLKKDPSEGFLDIHEIKFPTGIWSRECGDCYYRDLSSPLKFQTSLDQVIQQQRRHMYKTMLILLHQVSVIFFI